jgi:hypothetical protein
MTDCSEEDARVELPNGGLKSHTEVLEAGPLLSYPYQGISAVVRTLVGAPGRKICLGLLRLYCRNHECDKYGPSADVWRLRIGQFHFK